MKRACVLAFLISLNVPLRAQTRAPLSSSDQRARDIFEQLININTTGSSGSTTVASNAMDFSMVAARSTSKTALRSSWRPSRD